MNNKNIRLIIAGLLAVLVIGGLTYYMLCKRDHSAATEKVLMHHLESFGKYDIDELMKDYCEHSVVLVGKDKYTGLKEIRAMLEHFITTVIPQGSPFEIGSLQVSNKIAYTTWRSSSKTHLFPLGSDTYYIRHGKILVQTVALYVIPKKTP